MTDVQHHVPPEPVPAVLRPEPTVPSVAPAGWYPDPEVPGSPRYWDGSVWAPSGFRPPAQVAPATPPTPTTPPTPLFGYGDTPRVAMPTPVSAPIIYAAAPRIPAAANYPPVPTPYQFAAQSQAAAQPHFAAPGAIPAPVILPRQRRRAWPWVVGAVGVVVVIAGAIGLVAAAASVLRDTPGFSDASGDGTDPSGGYFPYVDTQTFSGTGDDSIPLSLEGSPALVTFECADCTGVTQLETDGFEGVTVDRVGSYVGTRIINNWDGSEVSELMVTATGDWTITVEDTENMTTVDADASGDGDSVVYMESYFDSAAITNDGGGAFEVLAYGEPDVDPHVVVAKGPFDASMRMAGYSWVEITSDGHWTITPE